MSLPRYSAYKDSGVKWLGEVPRHWEVSKLSAVALQSNAGEVIDKSYWSESGEILYTCARDVLFSDYVGFPDAKRTTANDILLTRNGTPYIHLPVVGAIYTNVVQRVSLDEKVNRNFIRYTLGEATNHLVGYGVSIESLNYELWRALRFPLPASEEQQTIAAFLDSETGKIDALIAEQQRLVELLAEKRQAVISHAVTKGLGTRYSGAYATPCCDTGRNPAEKTNPQSGQSGCPAAQEFSKELDSGLRRNDGVVMKNSGIEWLGEVPEHWEVYRLGTLFQEVADEGQADRPILSVSIHDGVSDRELDDKEMDRKVTRSEDRGKYKCVEPGDLVYNMMRAWQGGFGTVEVSGMVSPAYVVARSRFPFSTEFIEQQLRSPQAVEEMRRHSRGVTDFRLRLYWDEFKSISVAMAPSDEQNAIAAFLDTETAKFDTLTAEANRAIALLQERRSALISAAVTGKIDVRHAVTPAQAGVQQK